MLENLIFKSFKYFSATIFDVKKRFNFGKIQNVGEVQLSLSV